MRVRSRFLVDEPGDFDDFTRRRLRGRKKLHGPRIVAGPVVDHEPCVGNCSRRRGIGLEFVRILVRMDQDADDRNVGAADLLGNAAVHPLCRNDLDRLGTRAGNCQRKNNQTADECAHGLGSFVRSFA